MFILSRSSTLTPCGKALDNKSIFSSSPEVSIKGKSRPPALYLRVELTMHTLECLNLLLLRINKEWGGEKWGPSAKETNPQHQQQSGGERKMRKKTALAFDSLFSAVFIITFPILPLFHSLPISHLVSNCHFLVHIFFKIIINILFMLNIISEKCTPITGA